MFGVFHENRRASDMMKPKDLNEENLYQRIFLFLITDYVYDHQFFRRVFLKNIFYKLSFKEEK